MSSHYVLPKELIEKGEDEIAKNPIGTGPYKFVKWNLGDSVEFVRFDEYWEGQPAIEKLTYRIIPEGSSRTIALEAGEIDFIVEVENNDLQRLEETEGLAVINQTGTSFNFLVLNNERAPFDNQDFRHFMNCAIDKDALVMVALNGAGTGNYTQTPIIFAGAADNIPDKLDKEMAQKYLDASGIDPKSVSFSCICSDDVKRRCGEVIQATLAEYGVTMNLESMDLATYLSVAADGDFDTCIGGYTSSNMMGFVEGKFTEKQLGGSNWSRTIDPKIDEMYADLTKILDADERNAAMTELCNYINEICPQVPTYGANVTRAYNDDLQGIRVSATNGLYWGEVSWN
jgi:peptide/nickel transport system substrate-binding protein